MQSTATTVTQYIDELPEERKAVMQKLRQVINKHLPKWFLEQMSYGMIWRVVPHSIYPSWYHCDPKLPLPFLAIASQKNAVVLYHMWLYADSKLLVWFHTQYPKHAKKKLDMGKSCIRFRDAHDIPYDLLGELVSKMSVQQRVVLYQKTLKKN